MTNKLSDTPRESRDKNEEKGKDNENWQDMCKNHQGLKQEKEGICKIYYLWVTVITPDICQILQEKPNGKLTIVLICMKKWPIQIRSQHSPKLCHKPEIGWNKPLVLQNYIKIWSFWYVTSPLYIECLFRISNLRSLTQIAYRGTCSKPVGLLYKNKPFSTKIKLFYVKK